MGTYKKRTTPGVYINELDAFPPSVVGIATALPAFIGYTQKAERGGQPVINQPVKIRSMVDFHAIFGGGFNHQYKIEVVQEEALNTGFSDFVENVLELFTVSKAQVDVLALVDNAPFLDTGLKAKLTNTAVQQTARYMVDSITTAELAGITAKAEEHIPIEAKDHVTEQLNLLWTGLIGNVEELTDAVVAAILKDIPVDKENAIAYAAGIKAVVDICIVDTDIQSKLSGGSNVDEGDITAAINTHEQQRADVASDDVKQGKYDFKVATGSGFNYYNLTATDESNFNLYKSMLLYYANGGGTCYIVSVGLYEEKSIAKSNLEDGLKAIGDQVGPTMLVVPDALLLADDSEFGFICQKMLQQCGKLQDRVAILDIYNGHKVDRDDLDTKIEQFHGHVGSEHLSYGMSYFPFLETSVISATDINYTNIDGFEVQTGELAKILTLQNIIINGTKGAVNRVVKVQGLINDLQTINKTKKKITELNQSLTATLPSLGEILNIIATKNNILPPSGAMAGVFCASDENKGIWNAPANVSLNSVVNTTLKLTDEHQGELNVPINGKSVCILREFTGRGTVVWGGRTLDGNSDDWRYIQVRRTLIYIEQSIKNAIDPYVFSANDGNTWSKVTAMVTAFLQGLWSQGGLLGDSASEAFSVQCGRGSTMTGQDILDGYMIVQVEIQMIRPAEFIELTFKQTMEGAG